MSRVDEPPRIPASLPGRIPESGQAASEINQIRREALYADLWCAFNLVRWNIIQTVRRQFFVRHFDASASQIIARVSPITPGATLLAYHGAASAIRDAALAMDVSWLNREWLVHATRMDQEWTKVCKRNEEGEVTWPIHLMRAIDALEMVVAQSLTECQSFDFNTVMSAHREPPQNLEGVARNIPRIGVRETINNFDQSVARAVETLLSTRAPIVPHDSYILLQCLCKFLNAPTD